MAEGVVDEKIPETTQHKVKKDVRVNYGSTEVLKMVFVCNGGYTTTWNVKYPKDGLTKLEVKNLMTDMITNEYIVYNGNEITEIKEAYIYVTQYVEIPTN